MAQVITTILLDDTPKGLRLIEMANWSGRAFVVPRGKLKELRLRDEEVQQPGLYFLFGEGEERLKVYIGQSENVAKRLLSHDASREENEWDSALLFVGELDNALIKYLESMAIGLVQEVNRYDVLNNTTPKKNKLSEAQKIIASEYFERIKLIIGFSGYSVFEAIDHQKQKKILYYFTPDKANAKGTLLEGGEFIVYKGSLFRKNEVESFKGTSSSIDRLALEHFGILKKKNNDSFKLTEDHIFSSPSAAAASVAARSANGWICWKDENGKTLDENVRQ